MDKKVEGLSPAAVAAAVNGDPVNFMVASIPGGIERQEKQGQLRFEFGEESLPKVMLGNCSREVLEKLGFEFGEDLDDLFVAVRFPDGWGKQATDHSMHSYLLDEKGRKRGSLFYKAAFYDRKAHMSLNCRFTTNSYGEGEQEGTFKVVILDAGEHRVTIGTYTTCNFLDPKVKKLRQKAEIWLNVHYPDWKNPQAYWDET